ncbi:MAG: hypothetical protein U9R66_01170 [Thermodesulfobacteriota bacterium]|nr:hypothetical protein [Thermodesulfobacteriota bacterium]
MEDFDEDPLGLLNDDGDGDGVVKMCLLFDDDGKISDQVTAGAVWCFWLSGRGKNIWVNTGIKTKKRT